MQRTLLKSKIHRVTTTQCELHYEGSCAIDENLLDAANICENEQVHIWNINNGERFITYAIRGERGSGIISVNGSAARRAAVGDLLELRNLVDCADLIVRSALLRHESRGLHFSRDYPSTDPEARPTLLAPPTL